MRSGTPTCGAASPMPGAAYIVSIMSSISCCRSRRRSRSTGAAGACRAGARRSAGSDEACDRRLGALARRAARCASPTRGRPASCARQLGDRVAAELLEQRVGEHERHHRLADDRRGRHGADVAALDRRRRFGHASSDRPSAAASSASRSASCTPDTRRSSPLVTPPSRPPALLVGRATPATRPPAGVRHDLVVDPRARARRGLRAEADADRLDRGNRHQRLRQPAVELAIPLHVAAEADRHAGGDHLEGAAERVAGFLARASIAAIIRCSTSCVDAAQRRVVGQRRGLRRTTTVVRSGSRDAADREDVAGDAGRRPRASSCRATAPAATRAAVSRALARSRTSRMSSWSYLARRRGRRGRAAAASPAARLAPVGVGRRLAVRRASCCCQFTQSRFSISSAIGPPIVSPARTPERISARSDSIAMRRPRP